MTTTSPRPADLVLPPLYPIIDVDLCRIRGLDPVAVARACLDGGARLLQVRQKGQSGGDGALLAIVREVVAAARPLNGVVIVNDRADIAAMAGAAGVHVGQQDLRPEAARSVAGARAVVGVSTHTPEQIDEALTGAADYLAVGPVFRTSTKDTGYEPRGLELVRYAAGRGRPVVAIGGITMANARAVFGAGANAVALISDLLAGPDPAWRVRGFLSELRAD